MSVVLLDHPGAMLCLADTFVVFHIDGDRPWAKRRTSENKEKFDRLLVNALPQVVDRGRVAAGRARNAKGSVASAEGPRLRIENLLLLCPFRSIEAWLYQNLKRAVDICRRHHGARHVADLAAWEEKRGMLDELGHPEKELCLKKEHNLELASSGFPAELARAIGKSFAESVGRMEACADLRAALERTLVIEHG